MLSRDMTKIDSGMIEVIKNYLYIQKPIGERMIPIIHKRPPLENKVFESEYMVSFTPAIDDCAGHKSRPRLLTNSEIRDKMLKKIPLKPT